jgi:uncharacterized DUF497 family protein
MLIEFDTAKDAANLAKHGISLAFGARIFDDADHTFTPTIREGDEEDRFKLIGMVDGKLYTLSNSGIHVWRGTVVRFLSVRRSNASEQREYDRN